MNDVSPSTSGPALDDRPAGDSNETDGLLREEGGAGEEINGETEYQTHDGPPVSSTVSQSSSVWHERLRAKRQVVLDEFFETLDWLVYVQLAAIYYLDTSTSLLLFRLITHLTPLPSTLSLLSPLPKRRTHTNVVLPLLTFLASILLHTFASLPTPDEATRFDNYGHIFIDFVGQRAPAGLSGRLHLIFMDTLLCICQTIMCGVADAAHSDSRLGKTETAATQGIMTQSATTLSDAGTQSGTGPVSQNANGINRVSSVDRLVGEVRRYGAGVGIDVGAGVGEGVHRAARFLGMGSSQNATVTNREDADADAHTHADVGEQDIELQPLAGSSSISHHDDDDDDDDGGRREANIAITANVNADTEHFSSRDLAARRGLEDLYSGQAMLLDLNIWDMLITQYYEARNRRLAGRV